MNKVALITGASSGIGMELARIHAKAGGDLIIVARSEEKLRQLRSEVENKFQVNVAIIAKDLTLPTAAQEICDEVKKAGIDVEYLINNAGFGGRGKFHERNLEDEMAMIQLNVTTLTALTGLFLPDMVKKNSGKILNVSSTASLMPGPMQAVYFATKAFVTYFSNAVAEELHDKNITVTALLPGATETGFAKTADMDKTEMFAKTASARDVAQAGYDGMLTGKLDVISGVTFGQKIMMSTLPFMPKKILLKMIRKMHDV